MVEKYSKIKKRNVMNVILKGNGEKLFVYNKKNKK